MALFSDAHVVTRFHIEDVDDATDPLMVVGLVLIAGNQIGKRSDQCNMQRGASPETTHYTTDSYLDESRTFLDCSFLLLNLA